MKWTDVPTDVMRAIRSLCAAALSTVALVACLSDARADVIPGSQKNIQGWTLTAYNLKGRAFNHCGIFVNYRSGITLHFVMFASRVWSIGWSHDSWAFRQGQRVALQLHVDGTGPHNLTAIAQTRNLMLAELPAGAALYDIVRRGSQMTLQMQGGRIGFALDGTSAGLSELAACVDRFTQVAQAVPPPAATSTASRAPSTPRTATPKAVPLPEPKLVNNLPLQNGTYVNATTSCDKASEDSLRRVSKTGIRSPRAASVFKQIVRVDWKTFRVTQTHVDARTDTLSTTTVIYELTSPSSYREKDGSSVNEWRFCAALSLPESLRAHADDDHTVERRREGVMQLGHGVTRVVFTEQKDPADIVAVFPFLEMDSTDTVLFAHLHDVNRRVDLLFLRQEGMINCGSLGCGTTIYANEGSGYKVAANLTIHQPIYVMKTESGLSLILCTQRPRDAFVKGAELNTYVEWPFKNHVFDHKGPVTLSNPPGCSP